MIELKRVNVYDILLRDFVSSLKVCSEIRRDDVSIAVLSKIQNNSCFACGVSLIKKTKNFILNTHI